MSKGRLNLHNITQQLERLISDFQLVGRDLFDRKFTKEQDAQLKECRDKLEKVKKSIKEQRGL